MLKLQLFGTGQASFNEHPIVGFPHQQAHTLLCFLLLNPNRPHSRDQLATLLWGDYSSHTARKYLRNNLWKMRQALEAVGGCLDDFLVVDDQSVTLTLNGQYWLDVDEFEACLAVCAGSSGLQLSAAQAASLEAAVALYQDDLLMGVYEDWCIYDRERYLIQYMNALAKLVDYHEAQGNYERSLSLAGCILARDNTRENTHLQMMRLHWLRGDRSAALAQYRRCAQIQKEVLGVEPMKELTQVYQQMLHHQYQPSAAQRPLRRPEPVDPYGQVGRYALEKLKYLQAVIDEANLEIRQLEKILHQGLME